MSDDFDKEAERQRLRKKYEADKEDRESTERMSELLLQGATMTNRHCDTCGSPIFRHQGQEFCPNCQMADSGDAATAGGAEGAGQGQQPAQQPAPRQHPQQPAAQGDQQPATQQNQQPTAQQPTQPRQPQQGHQPSGDPAEGGSVPPVDAESLEEVRASLTQTLARFAQRAATTEDPHRAREHLETAKRAAETLRELPR